MHNAFAGKTCLSLVIIPIDLEIFDSNCLMWISKLNFLSIVIPRYLTDSLIGIMDPLKTRCMLGGELVAMGGIIKTDVFLGLTVILLALVHL